MQKTDRPERSTEKPAEKSGRLSGWLGLLLIAIVSGLVVRVIGDPLVEVFGPKVENAVEEAGDFVDDQLDQDWGKKLHRWIEQIQEHRTR